MTVPVYYNFKPITVTVGADDYKTREIILLTQKSIANVRLYDVNYFAFSLYITKQGSSTYYLVVKCVADPTDMTSSVLFFVVPLMNPNTVSDRESDIDNIMAGGTTTLDLQKYLKFGAAAVSKNMNNSITVMVNSASISVNSSLTTAYNSAITNLQLDANIEATVTQQELDWVLSCDLLDENGEAYPNPTMNGHVNTVDSANTITFLMMSLMIAGTAYLIGPTVYNMGGLNTVAGLISDGAAPNHYSINIYWGIILILSAVFCVVKGALVKQDMYYFLAIGLVLSYFSATSAILKLDGVANDQGTGFKNTSGMFDYIAALSSSESRLAMSKTMKPAIRMVAALLFYAGMIIGIIFMNIGVSKMDDAGRLAFSSGILAFIGGPGLSMLLIGNYSQ